VGAGTLAHNAALLVLSALIAGSWIGAHLPFASAGILGVTFIACSLVIGVLSPVAGLIVAVVLVPFLGPQVAGFPEAIGAREFARSAPIWGGVVRIVFERIRHGRNSEQPNRIFLISALACILLGPMTRIQSQMYPEFQAGPIRVLSDMLGIFGTQSAMWGAWILASHLPRRAMDQVQIAFCAVLPVALAVALAAFVGIDLVRPFSYSGTIEGRLASLTYPTYAGMGIAIALPLAGAVAWKLSHSLTLALVATSILTVFLTSSRGPLIAMICSGVVVALSLKRAPRRLIVAGSATGTLALIGIAVQRYGHQVFDWLNGRTVDFVGASDSTRIASWIASFQIAIKHPLGGAGWFGLKFWDPIFAKNNVAESHNLILHALASGGVPYGLATAVGILGSSATAWRNRASIPVEWVAAAVALIVCGLWDMPQIRALSALYGGIALGFVARRITAPTTLTYEVDNVVRV
jgi:hypothetical protein